MTGILREESGNDLVGATPPPDTSMQVKEHRRACSLTDSSIK